MITPLSVCGLVAFTGGQAPETVLLQYKFPVGRQLHYKTNMKMDLHMTTQGKEVPINLSTDIDSVQSVESVDGQGVATVSTKFLALKSTVNGEAQPNDSKLMDRPSKVTMDVTGKVNHVDIPGQSASDPGLKLDQMQIGAQLPKDAVHVGSTWSTQTNLPSVGTFDLKSTVKSIELVNGHVIATIQGDTAMDIASMIAKMAAGKKVKGDGTVNVHLAIVFDATGGFVKSNKVTTDLNFNVVSTDPSIPGVLVKESGTQAFEMELVP